jgi:hypothetical protein
LPTSPKKRRKKATNAAIRLRPSIKERERDGNTGGHRGRDKGREIGIETGNFIGHTQYKNILRIYIR